MEVDPLARPVLAVDFDGVVHEAPPYASNGPIDGDPAVPGAIDWLHTVAQVFRIVFFSTSATTDEARTRIVNWLTDNGFSGVPYTVTNVKPVAVAFLDDRAIRFDGPGSFPSVATILAAQPWWELKGVAHDAPPQVVASAVAAEARSAEPDVTAVVDAVVRATGGTLVGEENRLKAPETIAAKVEKNAREQQANVAATATALFDALRYAITYPDGEYTADVEAALSGLAARGHLLRRLRNYWDPAAPQGTTQPVPVYYAVNAVLQTPGGYDYEIQFHTPESWRVNIEENWPLYEQLRAGDESQELLARMRQNLLSVPIPAGASQIAAPRPVPHPAPLVADARPKIDIAEHNAITRKAAARAWDELEPRLATLIEPVLRRAGRQAAHKFTTLSQKSLRAAAYRTADNRRLAALPPGAIRALFRSLALTAAGVPGMEANSTMVAVMPTPEQAKALAVGDQDPDILHVTLAYLGEVDGPLTQIADALAPVAASFAPLTGKVAGSGQFGDTVELLLPDVPGLVELRVAVTEALANADVDYGREHGYQPHITVGYLPGEIPDEANYRLSLSYARRCDSCSYFQARGWCQMFGAPAEADHLCDDWTNVPPPVTPTGAPLDFMELLIVRGNNDYVRLPLVGSPPLTAAATGERGLQSTEAEASAQALLADETILESQLSRALQSAKSGQTVNALRSAQDELETRKRMLVDAQHSGDPERVHIAERNLELAQRQVRHLLTEATAAGDIPPILPPGPSGPGQPVTPAAPPGQVQPAGPTKSLPKAELPKAPEVGHEIQKEQTQDLFAPAESSATTKDSVKLAGQNLSTLLEDEAFLAQPAEQAIETVEQTPPEWTKPARSELLNSDELASQVRGVTDPVRQAVIQSMATPVLENVGIGWDQSNPFAAQVLAQSASQVTAITETTQADVMDAINQAYEQGLSIPDTAKLIRAQMTDASPARARLIARTELAGAVNGGSLAATQIVSQATGTAYQKSWMTAPGAPHPRHENYDGLDGQVADLDGLFQVGDARLKFPGDPDGPPDEVCNCRCSLSYQEGSGTAQAPDVALPDQVQPTADASVIPAGTLQTSDPEEAALALAAGQNVMLNQADEIATFLEDLGKEAAQAQAAGKAALNLDLGKVSVKGTNLFTQDSLGIPRIDMPQLSGTPLPGSLASKLPGGYEGQADQVDIGPLFYQHLREQGVTITEEDALASHLRSTQKDINGAHVASLMDQLEAGTAQERRIPVSADGYIVDGHHEWAATIGLDYKTGTDAGLTLPVFRINQPITKILAEANAFDDHYGIPRVSAFVPKVKDAGTARVLARSEPPVATVKDPILGITPFRAGEDNALGFYDSAKAQQFEADLKARAQAEGLTITSSQHVTGVWEGETEPSYAVHMLGSPEKVNAFAEEMRARYNQDSVMVFVPQKDMPAGMTPNAIEFRLPISDTKAATAKMQAAGVQGATIRGHTLTSIVTADNPDGVAQIGKLADSLGLDRNLIRHRDGHVEFVSRPDETPALTEPTDGPVQPFKAPDPNVELAVGAGMPQYQADYTRAVKPLVDGLPFGVRDWTSKYDVQDVLMSDENARTAKQEVTDGIVARLKDDPAWQDARPQESIAASDVRVGDYVSEYGSSVIRVDSVAPDMTIDREARAYNLREGDVFKLSDPAAEDVHSAFPDHQFTLDTKFETTNYDYNSGESTAKVIDAGGATGVNVGDVFTFPYPKPGSGMPGVHVDIIHDKNLLIKGTVVAPSSNGRMGAANQIYVTDPTRKLQLAQEGNIWQFPQGQGGVTDRSYTALSVSGLVDTWAGTSADSNPWAIAVQKAVNDEFDIHEDAFKLITGREQNAIDAAEALYAEKGPALRAFVRAQYDNTQLALRTAGLHDVTLYRGMSLGELDNETLASIPHGAHINEVALQPASSFSADYNTARGFTGNDSAIVAAQVPADRILSMPRTGNGCLNETEYIVLAPREGMPKDQAYVYRYSGYGGAPSNAEKFWQAGADKPPAPPASPTYTKTSDVPVEAGSLKVGDLVQPTASATTTSPFDFQPGTVVKITAIDPKGAVFGTIVEPGGTAKLPLGEKVGFSHPDLVYKVAPAGKSALPTGEFAKVSVDPTTVEVGDLVKIDMDKSKYFQGLGYAPDSVFKVEKVTPGGKAAVKMVDPGTPGQAAQAGTYLDLMPDEHVFVAQVPPGPGATTPGIPMPDVFGVNGMTHEVKIGDMKPGETFSITTYTGAHPVYKLDDINEDTGVAHVTVVGADPQLSPGDKTFFGVDVEAKTTPPLTAKSTAWTQGSGTLWNQLSEGDTFVSNGLGGKAAGPVLKYVGKDTAGVPLAEVVDPAASPFKAGAVVPLNKGDTLYHVTGEASEAKPPKSTTWATGAAVTDPHPGDLVAGTEGLFKGAVFSVTGLNKVPGAEVVGTVVDPGKSKLNVGETYVFTKSGLVSAKPWPQQ